MTAPRSLPVGLKPYAAKMSPGSAFGVVREVNGKKTSPHNGCDFPTPVGIPLEATITGRVSSSGGSMTNVWGYYLHITCDCPLRHVVEYHILRDKPTLKVGDRVTVGQIIGHTGQSGSLFGKGYAPHHHHGTSVGGKYYNPLTIGWPSLAGNNAAPLPPAPLLESESDKKWITTKDRVPALVGFTGAYGYEDPAIAAIVKAGVPEQKFTHGWEWDTEVREANERGDIQRELQTAHTLRALQAAGLPVNIDEAALAAATARLIPTPVVDVAKLAAALVAAGVGSSVAAVAAAVDAALADNFAALPGAVADEQRDRLAN